MLVCDFCGYDKDVMREDVRLIWADKAGEITNEQQIIKKDMCRACLSILNNFSEKQCDKILEFIKRGLK